MTLDPKIILGFLTFLLGMIGTLIGVIYKTIIGRIGSLEETVGNVAQQFDGKSTILYTSASKMEDLGNRVGRLEQRIDRLEDSFSAWLQRIEQKIDSLTAARNS